MSPSNRFFSRMFSRFSRFDRRSRPLLPTEDEIHIEESTEPSTSDEQNPAPSPIVPMTIATTPARPSFTKRYERNYASASCSMFAIAALAVSLSDYRWFWLNGGLCNSKYIGLSMFFAVGKLFVVRVPVPWDPSAPMNEIYQFKPNDYMGIFLLMKKNEIIIFNLIFSS